MRGILAAGAGALVLLWAPALSGQPYRDDLPVPAYTVLQPVVSQLRESGPSPRMSAALAPLEPLVDALGKRGGVELSAELDRAFASGSREAALSAVSQLLLLDMEDLVERVRRDELTGWSVAKTGTRKAWLDFDLVAPVLGELDPDGERQLRADFETLAAALRDADWNTGEEAIGAPRKKLVEDSKASRRRLAARPESGGTPP